jgi:K+-transporting ATPase ATPase C chain
MMKNNNPHLSGTGIFFGGFWASLKRGLLLLLSFTVLLGILYPGLITLLSHMGLSSEADGSFVTVQGHVVGSELIGQSFTGPGYFWGRPSATSPTPYNAASSSGSNLAQSNPAWIAGVKTRVDQYHQADPANKNLIPADLVMASGSGLDPDISPLAAYYQVPRIAKARHISEDELNQFIKDNTQDRIFGIFGEPCVNVLLLNIALDQLSVDHAELAKSHGAQ